MKKTFMFWICFAVAILLAVYFAARISMTVLNGGDVINSIFIFSDSRKQNLSPVELAAGIAPGTRTYSVNLDEINARISKVPDVKTSAVRRMPNGNLAIKLKLHNAIAVWTDGEKFYPLSAEGAIIQRQISSRPENSVVFRGPVPADISKIAKTARNMIRHLDFMEWVEDRRWNINTNGGITVLLPEEDPNAAISALMILDKNHKILSKKIQLLDMRDTARILVK
ncbi:MAG: cell division protein FtsQ/DivIB [Rickettsiales bacterium]|nr:cell division protein FtsQ/DivIB [Rickettsiales bacterium]